MPTAREDAPRASDLQITVRLGTELRSQLNQRAEADRRRPTDIVKLLVSEYVRTGRLPIPGTSDDARARTIPRRKGRET
jgi:hypothetical protein